MPPAARVTAVSGSSPIVLIAPHGGRRDPVQRPWSTGRLRVNDLHTAALTVELAAALDAAALINADQDRNEVDWNRISAAHDGAPEFLGRLADLLTATRARHGRATVLVIHGWNVIQPVVDVGLGCLPGPDPFASEPAAAVSPGFANTALRGLVDACTAQNIVATVGARYPARHRENLLQLFTPRYRDDPRPLVRDLAAMAADVDAIQLELGIPLRWQGPWRRRWFAACAAARPLLLAPGGVGPAATGEPIRPASAPAPARRFEFTSPALCGLVASDPGGARLLLFPPGGGLVLFTGERLASAEPGCVGGLALQPTADGGLTVRFHGPLLRFPETTPFLDLERGLAGARLLDARATLEFTPDQPVESDGATPGTVTGEVTLEGVPQAIAGHGFVDGGAPSSLWPRLRAALRLGNDSCLVLAMTLDGAQVDGFLRRGGRRRAVTAATVGLASGGSPLDQVSLAVELEDGERIEIVARALHRLPVIRARGPTPIRLEFAACHVEGVAGGSAGSPPAAAGWCEVGGL